jgi:glycosyltransferase involved in cell wall biosynthesis
VHIGGGPLKAQLERQAAARGIAGRITWRGALPQPEVLAALRGADLFALASRVAGDGDRDGLPNVLAEAQSQGLACAATAVSAIPELVEDGVTGILVPPESPVALAQALRSLMIDPVRRAALGAAGRERVRMRFQLEPNLERLARRFGLGGE